MDAGAREQVHELALTLGRCRVEAAAAESRAAAAAWLSGM
jgi:hypothetical protein